MRKRKDYPFHSVEEEAEHHSLGRRLPKEHVPAYELAFIDQEFLLSHELRPVRLQLEYLKAEMKQIEERIESTIVIFGSSRILSTEAATADYEQAKTYANKYPNDKKGQEDLKRAKNILEKSHYYEEARKLGKIITSSSQAQEHGNFVIMTGGGPGIMEAANRGATEVDGKSIGLSIYLPTEEAANTYITPELHFRFHYFALRKMHFLMRARALIFFPGGYGTLDELFEVLTLMQTKKIKSIPVLLFAEKYWNKIINFQALVDENAIAPEDLDLIQFVESAEEAQQIINDYYKVKG